MPTISSEITSVDTLQIGKASDAFTHGALLLRPDGNAVTEAPYTIPDTWYSSTLNTSLAAFSIIMLILFLRRLVTVLPHIAGGLFNWKKLLALEDNMRLSRERDSVAYIFIPIACLCISRLDMLQPNFMSTLTPGMKTLTESGIIFGFIILRAILIKLFPERKFRHDACRLGNNTWYDFLIVLVVCYLLLIVIGSFSSVCMIFSHKMSYYVTGILWAIFLIKKMQIMESIDGQFPAFLYLCTIEILPAGLLVASIVYL